MPRGQRENQGSRFGIGEWYGHLIPSLSREQLKEFAEVGSARFAGVPCPFRIAADPAAECKKKGGVCTLRRHSLDPINGVTLDGPLVTLCPSRFWSGNEVFGWIGEAILGTRTPTLVKEVQFLSSVLGEEEEEGEGDAVGRIDTILVDPDDESRWCALEIQAVYFSGPAMGTHIDQYLDPASVPVFPNANRRPDYRSSGPKRLMPQLQIKVPTLRRWGKKMAVVVDKPFFSALGSMTRVPHLSNSDIAWFVVDYSTDDGSIMLAETIFTTLESSVDALTAGVPLSLDAFESEVRGFLTGRDRRSLSKVIRLSAPTPSPDGGSDLAGGAELPEGNATPGEGSSNPTLDL